MTTSSLERRKRTSANTPQWSRSWSWTLLITPAELTSQILSDRDVVDALPSLESERRGRYRHPRRKGRAQLRHERRECAVAGPHTLIEVRKLTLVTANGDLEPLVRLISRAIARCRAVGIQVDVAASRPRPLIVASFGEELDVDALGMACLELGGAVGVTHWRCVTLDRLPIVLASGVDVEPADAPIYVTPHVDKAFEYGGAIKWGTQEPTVLLGYNHRALDRTFREVPSDIAPDELDKLKTTFPNVSPSTDGETLLLSRIASGPPAYEFNYGYWIPGDPFDALRTVVVIGRRDRGIGSATRDAVSACSAVTWRSTEHFGAPD